MKKLCLKISVVLFFLALGTELFAGDPLSRSYIIDSLSAEMDSKPKGATHEKAQGKIIFDDEFLKKSSKKKKGVYTPKPKQDPLSNMRKKDMRWHLVDYRVRRGDNIALIAKRFNVSQRLIVDINSLSNPSKIFSGKVLKVPSRRGVFYRVRRGDSLSVIANRFDVSSNLIARHNGIEKNRILAGTKLFIPEGFLYSKKKNLSPKGQHQNRNSYNLAKTENHKKRRPHGSSQVDRESFSGMKDSPLMNKTIMEGKKRLKRERKLSLLWPLRGPITSGFGYRKHPFTGKKRFHCGMDIGATEGTKIRASAKGQVIFSGWKGAYGNMIVIAHKNDYITVYAHNSKLLVKVNQFVRRGEVIGLSGKTGAVTGSHLHFEVRKGIVPLNPRRFLKK